MSQLVENVKTCFKEHGEQQAEIERLRGVIKSVLGQLEDGFSICERCQHQEDTKEMDVVYELRAALKPQ